MSRTSSIGAMTLADLARRYPDVREWQQKQWSHAGRIRGKLRLEYQSTEQRRALARHAANIRWSRKRKPDKPLGAVSLAEQDLLESPFAWMISLRH